jgi:hypothetical protein
MAPPAPWPAPFRAARVEEELADRVVDDQRPLFMVDAQGQPLDGVAHLDRQRLDD